MIPNIYSSLTNLLFLILLDFSKTFDKVSHTKLLFKPHQHEITQNILSWIKAFLLGRSQCVWKNRPIYIYCTGTRSKIFNEIVLKNKLNNRFLTLHEK